MIATGFGGSGVFFGRPIFFPDLVVLVRLVESGISLSPHQNE
jgi:hypothetical protein